MTEVIVPSTTETNRVKALVLAVSSAGMTPPPGVSTVDDQPHEQGWAPSGNEAWTSKMIVHRAKTFLEYLLADGDVKAADEQQHDDDGDKDQHDHRDVRQPTVTITGGETFGAKSAGAAADHVVTVPVELLNRTRKALGYSTQAQALWAELSALGTHQANLPMLGLATTAELLEEISVRMRITQNSNKGCDLGVLCEEALNNLGAGVLEYRTVGPR